MSQPLRIAMHGAAGRMGCRVVALSLDDDAVECVAAWEQPGHAEMGRDAGTVAGVEPTGIAITEPWQGDPEVDVVIDFSVPDAALELVAQCRLRGVPLVLATTGFTDGQRDTVRAAARAIPMVWAPSMSLAVNLTMKLAEIAAAAWRQQGQQVDVEILERHHRFKEDAPSGTALRFGEIIATGMGQTEHRHGREGRVGPRPANEIGYHAIRAADNSGEHTILFAVPGETLELTVRSTNRDPYAVGALAAAKYLVAKPPALYSMWDVLGLSSID